jgi:hypothetical protein
LKIHQDPQDYTSAIPTTGKWFHYYKAREKQWEVSLTNGIAVYYQKDQKAMMKKKIQGEGVITNAEDLKQRILELLEEKDSFVMKFVEFFLSTFNGLYVVSGKNLSQSANHLPNAIDDIKSFVWFMNELFWQFFSTLNIQQKLYGVHHSTLLDYIQRKVHRTFFSLYERAVCMLTFLIV